MRVTQGLVVAMLGAVVLGGCHGYREVAAEQRMAAPPIVEEVAPQEFFDTAEGAVGALKDAVAKEDREALRRMFGPVSRELVSGDAVQDKRNFETFSKRVGEKTRVE